MFIGDNQVALHNAYERFTRTSWEEDKEVRSFIKSAECKKFLENLNSKNLIELAGQTLKDPGSNKEALRREIERYFE